MQLIWDAEIIGTVSDSKQRGFPDLSRCPPGLDLAVWLILSLPKLDFINQAA